MLETLRSRISNLPRLAKHLFLCGFDTVALSGAVWAAYSLRYGTFFEPTARQWLLIILAPSLAIPIFIRLGLYRAVLRYLPERSIWTMLQAMTLAALAWVVAIFVTEMAGNGNVPRSVPFLYWLLGGLAVIGSRYLAQWLIWTSREPVAPKTKLVIYGAGEAGSRVAQALQSQGQRIVGFLDDNKGLQGRDVAGIRVYPPEHLSNLVTNFGVNEVALSIPSLSSERRQTIIEKLTASPVRIRTLPDLADILSGKYDANELRSIDIDDLLGRSAVPPDRALLERMLSGRSILVTGAGGSIGSELCREIMLHRPRRLVLYEQNEYALYAIHRELAEAGEVVPILASISNVPALQDALRRYDVDALFHSAAHKHVPMVEANVIEGVTNNVFGTFAVTQAAYDASIAHFVLISSDKAVRPTNVMGATKRWSELIMAHFAERARHENKQQRFCAVRFGNVLGSSGSVVPLFREQIDRGGPITLTHPEMTRYFMSIHEAAELIVQAGALSEGGDVFLLEMGEPIRILDLARNMVRLAGRTIRDSDNPGGDIEIVTKGIRPGEKMYEELFYDVRQVRSTGHPKILRAATQNHLEVMPGLAELEAALMCRDEAATRNVLFSLIERSGVLASAEEAQVSG